MAQALSEEEFHRMQAQLLELRTQNYQLSDDLRKNTAELTAVRQKTVTLEKDYIKAQKALNKSKKAQEVDALLSENEMLQGKLHSQEDDFRLQNSTLMQELSKLCSQIEQLEQENQCLKEGKTPPPTAPSPASTPVDAELLRLQAENTALQKKMAALQQHMERRAQINDTTETDSGDSNGVQCQSDVSGKGEESSSGTIDRVEQAESKCVKLEQRLNELSGAAVSVRSCGVVKQGAIGWSAALCPITQCFGPEVELQLNTEVEEKRLLREQLTALESSKQTEITKLQEEITKLSDKLKKKQESFMRLQGEKEALYNDSRTKIDELQQKREEESKSMNLRIHRLQADLVAASQTTAELREQLQSRQKEHELALHSLKDQIQTVKTQELNLLRDQNAALAAEVLQGRAERDDLNSQLQESSFANSKLLEQLTEEGQDKDRLQRELEDAKKTAEKRKAMLDELAMELNQEKHRHKEELSDVRLQQEKEVLGVRARYEKELRGLHEEKNRTEEEIRGQLREEKARCRELEGLQQSVEELQAQVQAMEGTKGWFERRLKEAEENMEKNTLEHQENIEKLQKEHDVQLEEKEANTEQVRQLLTAVEKERDEHNHTIGKLKQEVKDTVDGQRILEKKGSAALKDLKRQLQLERKRADKLQERLQEILTNTKTRTGLEELVLSEISSPSRTQQTGDSSSVSSFSYREMMKEGAAPQTSTKSNTGSPQSQRPADLSDDEVSELFQRLAEVQQEKWMLEEKVKHLEVSCSSMADDICKKSAIIETYVMESRIGMELSLSSSLSLFVCLFSLSLPVSFTLYFLSLPLIAYQHGCLFVGHRPPGV
ncbi:GRIP1-associated protein 1-like isoform X2 [Hypomesus transpacificus]|uniref:GRIP1-associated protein 1-like isoform X2 n=1 Tax=Hypomesus transpacificus TaxID=137520 RepID=UPI001F07D481|nr:GRIP1-associated protein 1-like isoform X2 [Hypomesus transpacificus]